MKVSISRCLYINHQVRAAVHNNRWFPKGAGYYGGNVGPSRSMNMVAKSIMHWMSTINFLGRCIDNLISPWSPELKAVYMYITKVHQTCVPTYIPTRQLGVPTQIVSEFCLLVRGHRRHVCTDTVQCSTW